MGRRVQRLLLVKYSSGAGRAAVREPQCFCELHEAELFEAGEQ